ncbi:MAG: hypothetical protein LBD79_06155 [Treponema sp.]|jgi:membrane protein implicated in regulation of membrane protease activity|nr:hypothetical protein [Treponema sp.]
MLSEELRDFLIRILTSWQVIAVVLVAILYIMLVSYVARFRKRVSGPSPVRKMPKLSKERKPAKTRNEDDKEDDKK